MPDVESGLAILASGGVGAAALKLVQIFMESRRGTPSKAKDAADMVAATAAFQIALNTAAQGIVGDLRATVERLEAEIDNLKHENEQCRIEGEQLRQQARGLEQRIDSLLRQLKDPASTLPGGSLSGAVIELAEGDVKVTRPRRRDK